MRKGARRGGSGELSNASEGRSSKEGFAVFLGARVLLKELGVGRIAGRRGGGSGAVTERTNGAEGRECGAPLFPFEDAAAASVAWVRARIRSSSGMSSNSSSKSLSSIVVSGGIQTATATNKAEKARGKGQAPTPSMETLQHLFLSAIEMSVKCKSLGGQG